MENRLILIIDEVDSNFQLLKGILRQKGYQAKPAANGADALALLKTTSFDAVLLDKHLPDMSRGELCSVIKSDEQHRNTPIILKTDQNDTEDIVKGLNAGVDDYISTPVNAIELLKRIETHINLKRSQQKLHDKERELEEVKKHKEKFFSTISHDLKGPFQGLMGLTELLNNDIVSMSREEIQQFAGMINESAENLLNLVDNLLEWSLLERDKKEYLPKDIDLGETLEKVIRRFSRPVQSKHITVTNAVKQPLKAHVDGDMIKKVMQNLMSNAVKYTPENGSIEWTATAGESHVTLTITDSGVGMDEETQSKLFRADELISRPGTNKERGTGLGLIICKKLTEINRCTLQFKSTPGAGSSFTVKLPAASTTTNAK